MIFRAKLTILLLVVITAMVGVTLSLSSGVAEQFGQRAEEHLRSANEVVRLATNVEGYSATYEAVEIAGLGTVVEGLACPATAEALTAAREPGPEVVGPDGTVTRAAAQTNCSRPQHVTVLDALKDWDTGRTAGRDDNERRELGERDIGFAAPRQPDLLIVADAAGVVVARVGFDKDDWYGEGRPNMHEYSAVAQTELATGGEILGAQEDMIIWREHESAAAQLMHVGAAAVLDGDEYLGSVVVGYLVSDEIADEATQLLFSTDVAFFYRGEGDSVTFGGTTLASRPQELAGIGEAEFFVNSDAGGGEGISFAEFSLGEHGSFHTYEFAGDIYLALATPLSYSGNQVTSGFLVTTSLTGAVSPLTGFSRIIPMLGIALFLIGLLGILIAIRSFMQPVSDVSKGIQEVIAGNHSYMWEVDERSHVSDLAHGLNVMSARLQGMADPDAEDTEGDDDWEEMASPGAVKETKPAAVAGLGGLRGRAAAEDEDDDDDE